MIVERNFADSRAKEESLVWKLRGALVALAAVAIAMLVVACGGGDDEGGGRKGGGHG